jgi:ribonuclease Z
LKNSVAIESIPVTHCRGSFGCVCAVDGGYRIAYSGDRMVTDDFPAAVGQCDLLIHEATLPDEMTEAAAVKRHSTLGQAVQTASDAHARFTFLTHFSQRSPKLPNFITEETNVAFAADYMSCNFDSIAELCGACPQIFERIAQVEAVEDDADE